MANLYLCNSKDGYGNILNLKIDKNITRKFSDLALLDLTTMDIPKKDVNDYFKDLNPGVDLSGDYYITSMNLEHIYLPIFEPENKKAKEYIDELKELTIYRYDNIKTKHKADKLNREASEELVRKILLNIYKLDDKSYAEMTNKYNCVSNDLAEAIVLKNFGDNKKKTESDYVNKIILHDCRKLITSYTVVRDLVIAYTRLIDGEKIKLNTPDKKNVFIDSAGKGFKAKQLSMFDYM